MNDGCFVALLVVAVVLVAAFLGFAIVADSKEHNRLVQQCMADKHPEWWCEAQLKEDKSSTTVMPMPIIVSSGK